MDNVSELYPYDVLDIYLQKGDERIGLHAIGDKDSKWIEIDLDGTEVECSGFRQHEAWGNEYDENFKMIGRGSFRVFAQVEYTAKEFEADGWIRIEGPK